MKNDVLFNKHVFQNAVRSVRVDKKFDQTRELRDVASSSTLWNTELHLSHENVFEDMFFINRRLIAKRLNVDLVFVDDTSCTNQFSFPVISAICRSECGSVHTVAWGFLKNRTTQSFKRFFLFLFKYHPSIRVFVCDRHHAHRRAIAEVFGEGVSVLNCCVHIARNIVKNTGCDSTLASLFWKMCFQRTVESETAFLQYLERMHRAKRTMFTTRLLASTASFFAFKNRPHPATRTVRSSFKGQKCGCVNMRLKHSDPTKCFEDSLPHQATNTGAS